MVKKFRSNYLLIILIFILLFSISCGGEDIDETQTTNDNVEEAEATEVEKEKNDEVKETETKEKVENDKNSEEQIDFYNLKEINELKTLINLFEKFEYTWSSSNNSKGNLKYEIIGQEKVNESSVKKISIKITERNNEEEIIIWVNDKNQVVKAKAKGKEIPGELFNNMSDSLFESIFAPFTFAQEFMEGPIFNETHDPIPGYETKVEKKGEKSIGNDEYELYRVSVKVGPPYTENEKEVILDIADFGKYQLLIKLSTSDDSGDSEMEFEVNEIKVK
ncbi:MAG: hypothetical protein ACQEQE_04035 [Bacillota bacterium]